MVAVNNDVFGQEWGDLPIIFTSDAIKVKIVGESPHEWPKTRYSRVPI